MNNPVHDLVSGMLDSAERSLRMPERAPEREPETSRRQEAYDDAYLNVMDGADCSFYPTNEWRTAMDWPEYDNEQHIALFCAIKLAQSLIGATDAERYEVIRNALRVEAEKYANDMADERLGIVR